MIPELENLATTQMSDTLHKALGHLMPVQTLKDWQQQCPECFTKRVYNLAGLDNS
jgi:hypothetical protein